jgi:hypothetical protein
MRRIFLCVLAIAVMTIWTTSARTEMGPCKPDDHDGLTCGSGVGAARVIDKTISPSKRLALAWRATGAPPTEHPDDNASNLELIIVRINNGAILWKAKGVYWDTGDTHINNIFEEAIWSPDARLLIETFKSRYASDAVKVYAIGQDDTVMGPFDLFKVLDPAIRALMKNVKDADSYAFAIALKPAMTIDIFGHVHATVMMWMPKFGPERYYAVTAQVTRGANALDAKVLSVALTHVDKAQ